MPFVHVRSLSLGGGFDVARAVRAVSAAFAQEASVDERHVTVTWETIDAGAYASGGETADAQPAHSHPVLVDVLAPDANSEDRLEAMLRAAADAVARAAGVEPANVFVHLHAARSGRVFDGGEIARW